MIPATPIRNEAMISQRMIMPFSVTCPLVTSCARWIRLTAL
jgi:hypothetical protein